MERQALRALSIPALRKYRLGGLVKCRCDLVEVFHLHRAFVARLPHGVEGDVAHDQLEEDAAKGPSVRLCGAVGLKEEVEAVEAVAAVAAVVVEGLLIGRGYERTGGLPASA